MSRVINTIKNIKVNILFYILMIFVTFVSRKIYIQYLGDELVGLNSLIINILGFFNLAELGVSSAVSYALYKPLREKDNNEVNRIISIFGYMYSKIGIIILVSALIFSIFLPFFFEKAKLDFGYIYSAFLIFLFSNILGYFINYKQLIFTADQKNYKITILQNGVILFKVIIQVLCLLYTSHGYYLWITWEAIFAIINSKLLMIKIKKDYPWLITKINKGKYLLKNYQWIIKKTKQIFSHTFGSFVLNQTDTILVFVVLNLNAVTAFTNYTMIMNKISGLITSLFSNSYATVGDLIVENERHKIIGVFWEWMSLRHLIAFVFSFTLFQMTTSFISIWLGDTYIIDNLILYILIINTFISIERTTIDTYISGYGLFSDVWAPWSEALINLITSFICAYYFGLKGIVFGTFISLLIIIICWKPYFLYKNGFKLPVSTYWKEKFKIILSGSSAFFISYYISKLYTITPTNFISWAILAFLNTVTITLFCIIFLYICTKGMRDLLKRCHLILTHSQS